MFTINLYILLTLSIILAISNNLLLHGFANRGLRGLGDVLLYNALVSCVWIALLLPMSGIFTDGISTAALLWGILYGSVTALFLLSKMQAMASGPVSITSFIGCSSLLVSTAVGVIVFHETVTVLQMIGVVLLIAALFLSVSPKSSQSKKSWKFWCALFFLCSGSTGIIFKLHQASDVADEIGTMMLAAAVTSAALFALSSVLISKKTCGGLPRVPRRALLFALACGIVSCGYNRLNITVSGQLPSIVFFPMFNGAVILGASLLAAIIFREKLSRGQRSGMLLGIVSLLLASGSVDGILKIF
ncbi:MAG: hypothetical protein IJ493_05935 [Clostridia bacterium]|nr:hypothetical protein [Clostridia bacterium]